MDIFSVITLVGGLAFFLYGMNVLSAGLERLAGSRLEYYLKRMTSNRFKGLLLGIGITAAIQSSSAVTVMLVGLVNSGIMTLLQSISVIMGSNIGTSMTAWILTLVGVESDNFFVALLKPENFSLVFAFVGIIMIMASKSSKKKDIGTIFIGFAVLMYGMKLMSGAVEPLADMPQFTGILTAFKNPFLGVLAGLVITAVIQSSSASVGILQAISMTGSLSYGAAIPIIMGQNIGTCVTALISSLGVGKSAKRVAVVHMTFNIFGTIVCLVLYYALHSIFKFGFADKSIDVVGIALVHSAFNIFTTTLLLPAVGQLENFAKRVIKTDEEKSERKAMLDDVLLVTPSVAVAECDNLTAEMARLSHETLCEALSLISSYNEKLAKKILEKEPEIDRYEDELGSYLVKVSAKKLSNEDSIKISKMLYNINEFERLGDHAVNVLKSVTELKEKGLKFSDEAQAEISVLLEAIYEILDVTMSAYTEGDVEKAIMIEPLEQTVDDLVDVIKAKHIERLQAGECSIEMGFILSDLLTNFERISDHCSNIAVSVIELAHKTFDTHKYLNSVKHGDPEFTRMYDEYAKRFAIK